MKKLGHWLEAKLERRLSRNTRRTLLKAGRLSWKKCQKVLSKGNPEKRAQFIGQFQTLFDQMWRGEIRLVYLDEAHFHQNLDLGSTGASTAEPVWRKSTSPPLAARLNWDGAYDFSEGRCFIWPKGKCNGDNTIRFLKRLLQSLTGSEPQLVIIWDGAPWHRTKKVLAATHQLGIKLVPLPGYSPDLNPIEGLWKWMREEVSQLHCHATLRDLFFDCLAFIDRINCDPEQIIARLWPKFDLDPNYEKLLLSN